MTVFDKLTQPRAEVLAHVRDLHLDSEFVIGDIDELSSCTRRSVQNVIEELVEKGVLRESGSVSTGGRPATAYEVRNPNEFDEYVMDRKHRIRIMISDQSGRSIEDEITRCPNCNNAVVNEDRIIDGKCFLCSD